MLFDYKVDLTAIDNRSLSKIDGCSIIVGMCIALCYYLMCIETSDCTTISALPLLLLWFTLIQLR